MSQMVFYLLHVLLVSFILCPSFIWLAREVSCDVFFRQMLLVDRSGHHLRFEMLVDHLSQCHAEFDPVGVHYQEKLSFLCCLWVGQ